MKLIFVTASFICVTAFFVGIFFFITPFAHGGTTVTSLLSVGDNAPVVSGVSIDNNSSTIILTPNTTTSINVTATISDNDGCGDLNNGTTTVLLYRSGIGSSTCLVAQNSLDCYSATAFTTSSVCSATSINTTTTFGVWYYAQATDGSSSFPGQNWQATVIFTDPSSSTGSADSTNNSTTNDLSTLTAINVTPTSIGYGNITGGGNTGATNQSTSVQNVGNSSSTLQLSGTAFVFGANNFATSSQHFATTTFTFGGAEQQLSGTPTAVPNFLLTAPTSTSGDNGPIYWGTSVASGKPTGTYTATTTFTAVFSP